MDYSLCLFFSWEVVKLGHSRHTLGGGFTHFFKNCLYLGFRWCFESVKCMGHSSDSSARQGKPNPGKLGFGERKPPMMAERIGVCGAFFSTNHRSDINTEVMKWKVGIRYLDLVIPIPMPTTLISLPLGHSSLQDSRSFFGVFEALSSTSSEHLHHNAVFFPQQCRGRRCL